MRRKRGYLGFGALHHRDGLLAVIAPHVVLHLGGATCLVVAVGTFVRPPGVVGEVVLVQLLLLLVHVVAVFTLPQTTV